MSKRQDYDVGYGKTPVHTRWQKGQSGNPKGRPRKTSQDDVDAAMAFLEPIGGASTKQGTVTPMHAMYAQLFKRALGGDPKALRKAIDIIIALHRHSPDTFLKMCELDPAALGFSEN